MSAARLTEGGAPAAGMGFEGSYLGANDRISDQAVMECKICWTPYDPADGDEARQITADTPFKALPDDWKCPNCDAPKSDFMVLEDPGQETIDEDEAAAQARIDAMADRLVEEFAEVWRGKMREVPFLNKALKVEAVGFRPWQGGGAIGVLITPWFMNLVLLPSPHQDWSNLKVGNKERIRFPSGDYEFLHMTAGLLGGLKRCSLFSPMNDFKSHEDARAVAEEILPALFEEENREETDRAATIRAEREKALAAEEEAETAAREAAEEAAKPVVMRAAKPLHRRDLLKAWRSPSDPDRTPDPVTTEAADGVARAAEDAAEVPAE